MIRSEPPRLLPQFRRPAMLESSSTWSTAIQLPVFTFFALLATVFVDPKASDAARPEGFYISLNGHAAFRGSPGLNPRIGIGRTTVSDARFEADKDFLFPSASQDQLNLIGLIEFYYDTSYGEKCLTLSPGTKDEITLTEGVDYYFDKRPLRLGKLRLVRKPKTVEISGYTRNEGEWAVHPNDVERIEKYLKRVTTTIRPIAPLYYVAFYTISIVFLLILLLRRMRRRRSPAEEWSQPGNLSPSRIEIHA